MRAIVHAIATTITAIVPPLARAADMDHIRSEQGVAVMGYANRIKPVSYLKANAAEMLRTIAEDRNPVIITQNGEAKAVLVDLASYEETQETLAALKLVALGRADVAAGRVVPFDEVIRKLRSQPKSD